MRDVQFLSHTKPKDAEQAAVWKYLVENTLGLPDTWEVVLPAGKDKRENFKWFLPHCPAIGKTGAVGKPAAPFFVLTQME